MAKKKNNQNDLENKNKDSFGTKLATLIIIMIITLIWFAIVALLIRTDVGGLGTRLRPYLEEVPVVRLVLPPLTDEEIAYRERYPYKNMKEAIERINYLEELVDKYSEENDDYAERIAELQEENALLKHYEAEFEAYLENKEAFDRQIVYGDNVPNPETFIKWYESMYPENAAKIFEELTARKEQSEAVKEIANVVEKMDTKQAAHLLEQYTSDLDFICRILECLYIKKPKQVSELLDQMTKDDELFASRVANHWEKWKQGL